MTNSKRLSINAIVLAAGESKRYNKNKIYELYKGKSFIRHIISILEEFEYNRIIIVGGYEFFKLKNHIDQFDVTIINNMNYKMGMTTSILKGLEVSDKDKMDSMLFLGDQPFIDRNIIDTLLDRYKNNRNCFIVPSYNHHRGHPVIIPKRFYNDYFKLSSSDPANRILNDHNGDISYVLCNNEIILNDIDYPGDYKKYIKNV